MGKYIRWAVVSAAFVALSACTVDETPAPTSNQQSANLAESSIGPMENFPVGSTAPFRVFAHCGVEFTTIDGITWRTKPRDDGNGNPPEGWPMQVIAGTLTRPTDERAVFRSLEIPVKLVFRPAPDARFSCA